MKEWVTCSLLGLAAVGFGCSNARQNHKNGGADTPAVVDAAQFATTISGAPAEAASSDTVEVAFGVDGTDLSALGLTASGFECRFGADPAFKACDETLVISGLKDGESYVLTVRAVLVDATAQKVYAKEATVQFRVALDGKAGPSRTNALSSTLQIGAAYRISVPSGMHVTEYTTSKTTGVLSVFRIFDDADPYYLGNFKCANDWDRVVASVSPSGDPLLYCHSTPTRAAYKLANEFRLAHNHVEIATDAAVATETNHERLSISIYDQDYELMTERSRFNNSCLNSEKRSIDVPLVNDFFLGRNPETADFWYCDTYIPGLDGTPELWRVGAFYDVDAIDWSCPDCKWSRAVEMVYMARANASIFTPYDFAKQAQHRMLDLVTKVTP